MTNDTAMPTLSRARSITFCAAAIALITVSAWVVVPIGPIPLSLSLVAIFFTLFALKPSTAFTAIAGYVALGAIGLPVFAGFKGGIAALLGPTGGFITGYVVASLVALLVKGLLSRMSFFAADQSISILGNKVGKRFFFVNFLAGLCFVAVLYLCGWAWLMNTAHLSAQAAFLAAVAPFIIPDLLKMLLAVFLAQAVGAARLK